MNNTMEYKGYIGSVEFSQEDSIFHLPVGCFGHFVEM